MQPTNEKTDIVQEALALRREGYMYAEIAEKMGFPKSTVHGWISKVPLDHNALQKVQTRLKASKRAHVKTLNLARSEKKSARDGATSQRASDIVENLDLGVSEKQLVCAIFFWCEGGKNISSGFQFINSDPVMMQTFLSLLRSSFSIDETKFRALIHLHEYHDPKKQLQYWSLTTGIPEEQFHKSYLKPHTGKNQREGYPGCVSVRYLDRQFGLLLQMIYNNFGNKYRGVR